MNVKVLVCTFILVFSSCKLPKEDSTVGGGSGLFSIDSSGLKSITGVSSTDAAGDYAVKNQYIPTQKTGALGLTANSAIDAINKRCGLKVGMTVVMALSYLDGQTTGQLGGKAVLCKSMPGEIYQSIEWHEGEICFSPQNLTTTQLVRAPGHTDGPSSLMSLTEYCNDYTDFFLAMNSKPNAVGLTASLDLIPNADTLYRGGLDASQGTVNISLAGSQLRFSGNDSFVLTHNEGVKASSSGNGFYLNGEGVGGGSIVKAYHEGKVGFRGFTFSEKGKGGEIIAGEAYQPGQIGTTPGNGNLGNADPLGYADPSAYALKDAPKPEALGLAPRDGTISADRDLNGGEFQIFWQ